MGIKIFVGLRFVRHLSVTEGELICCQAARRGETTATTDSRVITLQATIKNVDKDLECGRRGTRKRKQWRRRRCFGGAGPRSSWLRRKLRRRGPDKTSAGRRKKLPKDSRSRPRRPWTWEEDCVLRPGFQIIHTVSMQGLVQETGQRRRKQDYQGITFSTSK